MRETLFPVVRYEFHLIETSPKVADVLEFALNGQYRTVQANQPLDEAVTLSEKNNNEVPVFQVRLRHLIACWWLVLFLMHTAVLFNGL